MALPFATVPSALGTLMLSTLGQMLPLWSRWRLSSRPLLSSGNGQDSVLGKLLFTTQITRSHPTAAGKLEAVGAGRGHLTGGEHSGAGTETGKATGELGLDRPRSTEAGREGTEETSEDIMGTDGQEVSDAIPRSCRWTMNTWRAGGRASLLEDCLGCPRKPLE